MNFRPSRHSEEPDINFIPLIDVLLVIVIFLAATTSFDRLNKLDITLPQASAEVAPDAALNLAVSREGLYALDGQIIPHGETADIAAALAVATAQDNNRPLVINADAHSSHESVIRVIQAARQAGLTRISFATQDSR